MQISERMISGHSLKIILMIVMLCYSTEVYPRSKEAYSPKFPSGINTISEAKIELGILLKNRLGLRWFQMCQFSNDKDAASFKKKYHVREFNFGDNSGTKPFNFVEVDEVNLLEDGIDVPFSPVYFDELPGITIKSCITPSDKYYYIDLPDDKTLYVPKSREDVARKIADILFFIQQNIEAYYKEQEAAFQEKAFGYRALEVKQPMSDEQRKLIVQANAMNERKEYTKAIDLYLRAIDVDPVSYPAAYYNLALLSAQVNRFNVAIVYMKRYLILEPDAKDAQDAQDKIYEWELLQSENK